MQKKQAKAKRTMRVVRSWLPVQGTFKYFTIYSDGVIEEATRTDAEQYSKAYDMAVDTIIGDPRG